MTYAIQWLRSLVFNLSMYLAVVVVGVGFFPWALFSRRGAYVAAHTWAWYVKWTAGWMINLHVEKRGTAPTDAVLVVAKHQSFLDSILLYSMLPRCKFIMKSELRFAPIVGQYALRLGFVPVNRGKRAQAIKQMLSSVHAGQNEPGQLVIYPQGTRVGPGDTKPYKVGSGALYRDLGQDCVPVACNVGVFWPKRGVYRKPGTIVVEFLDRIPAGLPVAEFMARIEDQIEVRSMALAVEAGFKPS